MFRDFKWIVHKKFDRNHTCFTKPGMQTQRWFSHVEYLGQAVQGTHCPSWQELPISHVPQTWVVHPLVTSPHTFSCAWQTCGNCSSGINGLHSGAATMKEVVSASHQTSYENSVYYFQEDTRVRKKWCCSRQRDFRRPDLCSRMLSWGSTRTDQSSTHPNINSCRDKSTMVRITSLQSDGSDEHVPQLRVEQPSKIKPHSRDWDAQAIAAVHPWLRHEASGKGRRPLDN